MRAMDGTTERKDGTAARGPDAALPAGERSRLPTVSLLIRAWALLMVLTIGTMIAGRVTTAASLGLVWTSILLLITWAKARTILMVYLNLRAAPAHWRTGFSATLVFLLLLILGIYAIDAAGLIPGR